MQMPTFSSTKKLAALFCSLAIVACGPPDEASRAKAGPIKGPFVVSDFFTPSGLMGDGAIPGLVTEDIDTNCAVPRPAGAQGDCYHFLYHIGPVKWAGAYWVFPSNSWGSVPGRDVIPPVDKGPDGMGGELLVYNHVRFSVAINPPMPVPPKFAFFAGGIEGSEAKPPQPYGDKGTLIFPADPTDPTSMQQIIIKQDFVQQGNPVELTGGWQELTIPLDTWDIRNVIGAFGWSMNDTENPGQTLNIYLDDIVWE
jgi:hypothetical protein